MFVANCVSRNSNFPTNKKHTGDSIVRDLEIQWGLHNRHVATLLASKKRVIKIPLHVFSTISSGHLQSLLLVF